MGGIYSSCFEANDQETTTDEQKCDFPSSLINDRITSKIKESITSVTEKKEQIIVKREINILELLIFYEHLQTNEIVLNFLKTHEKFQLRGLNRKFHSNITNQLKFLVITKPRKFPFYLSFQNLQYLRISDWNSDRGSMPSYNILLSYSCFPQLTTIDIQSLYSNERLSCHVDPKIPVTTLSLDQNLRYDSNLPFSQLERLALKQVNCKGFVSLLNSSKIKYLTLDSCSFVPFHVINSLVSLEYLEISNYEESISVISLPLLEIFCLKNSLRSKKMQIEISPSTSASLKSLFVFDLPPWNTFKKCNFSSLTTFETDNTDPFEQCFFPCLEILHFFCNCHQLNLINYPKLERLYYHFARDQMLHVNVCNSKSLKILGIFSQRRRELWNGYSSPGCSPESSLRYLILDNVPNLDEIHFFNNVYDACIFQRTGDKCTMKIPVLKNIKALSLPIVSSANRNYNFSLSSIIQMLSETPKLERLSLSFGEYIWRDLLHFGNYSNTFQQMLHLKELSLFRVNHSVEISGVQQLQTLTMDTISSNVLRVHDLPELTHFLLFENNNMYSYNTMSTSQVWLFNLNKLKMITFDKRYLNLWRTIFHLKNTSFVTFRLGETASHYSWETYMDIIIDKVDDSHTSECPNDYFKVISDEYRE